MSLRCRCVRFSTESRLPSSVGCANILFMNRKKDACLSCVVESGIYIFCWHIYTFHSDVLSARKQLYHSVDIFASIHTLCICTPNLGHNISICFISRCQKGFVSQAICFYQQPTKRKETNRTEKKVTKQRRHIHFCSSRYEVAASLQEHTQTNWKWCVCVCVACLMLLAVWIIIRVQQATERQMARRPAAKKKQIPTTTTMNRLEERAGATAIRATSRREQLAFPTHRQFLFDCLSPIYFFWLLFSFDFVFVDSIARFWQFFIAEKG